MIERRFSPTPSTAPTVTGSGIRTITGYGAVFYDPSNPKGTEYELFPNVFERIDKNAFTRSIKEREDVRGLFNHDANFILGRTRSGSLQLSTNFIGLKYEIEADESDPFALHAIRAIERGDVSGSSFGFIVLSDKWQHDGKIDIRTILDVMLLDVSPVVFPAYTGTSAHVPRAIAYDELVNDLDLPTDKADRDRAFTIAAKHKILKSRMQLLGCGK